MQINDTEWMIKNFKVPKREKYFNIYLLTGVLCVEERPSCTSL